LRPAIPRSMDVSRYEFLACLVGITHFMRAPVKR
jgi:hypothetical protein